MTVQEKLSPGGVRMRPEGGSFLRRLKRSTPFYLMVLPGVVFLLIFNYLPLFGLHIAFQKFIPAKGFLGDQEWAGLYWFRYIFNYPDFMNALRNTLVISFSKIVMSILIAVFFSILINEVRHSALKRTIQTIVYLPHFLSWVILATVFIRILSPSNGIVNNFLGFFGVEPVFFLGSNDYFQGTVIVTELWKEFGFNTIVYLAAITSIDPSLYESVVVDGGGKLKQIWYITLPGILPIVVLMLLLNIGTVMNANFDQIYNLYSPTVYQTGDVLDTMVYRVGLVNANYSLSTAIGMFKSLVSFFLVSTSYYLAYKFAGYRIF